MSEKSRGCSNCRGVMEFRLGEFVCPNCGITEPGTPPKDEPQQTGPGFRDEKTYIATVYMPEDPDVVPIRPTEGSLYSMGADAQAGKEEPSLRKFTRYLQTEKHLYFGLSVIAGVIKVVFGGFQHNPADTLLGPAWGAIGIGAWLLALAFALFGSDLYFKYGCMGWAGVAVVGTVSSVFYINTWFSQFTAPGLAGRGSTAGVLVVILAVFGVAWQVWLIWILYRDSQRLQ